LSLIEGVQVFKSIEFDAKQCLFDVRFRQLLEEISMSKDEPCPTPRSHKGSVAQQQNYNTFANQPVGVHKKLIEFFAPEYFALLYLMHVANPDKKLFEIYGLSMER